MRAALDIICWLAAIVYATIPSWWLVIHPFADSWRKMRRSPYRALVPIWMVMWLIAGSVTWPWRSVHIYSSYWPWLASAALFAISFSIYRRARRDFGAINYSGQTELRPAEFEQQLVVTGLHARLRHPIYVAHFCTLAAFVIGSGLLVSFCLLGFALLTGTIMIVLEERELERRFGRQWRDYKLQVPAFFPRLRRARKFDAQRGAA